MKLNASPRRIGRVAGAGVALALFGICCLAAGAPAQKKAVGREAPALEVIPAPQADVSAPSQSAGEARAAAAPRVSEFRREAAALEPLARLEAAALVERDRLDAMRERNILGGPARSQDGFVRALPNAGEVRLSAGTRAGAHAGGLVREAAGGVLVWIGEIAVDGAYGLRVGLTGVSLPKGAEVWTYGEDGAMRGPVGRGQVTPEGDLWCPTAPGPTVWVEVRVPAGALGSGARCSFSVSSVAEIFQLDERGAPLTGAAPQRGESCLVDLRCASYPSFVGSLKTAVGQMRYVSGGSSYVCTGGLLNDTVDGTIPYFLTANHCLTTQSEASSLEAAFDYDNSSCGAGFPFPSNVVYGSTLLTTSSTSDVTLLRLAVVPSGSRTYLGWTTRSLAGDTLYRVSHPHGYPTHYSQHRAGNPFGNSCSGLPSSNFHYSETLYGATAGGSSGSPVCVYSDGSGLQVVGQLYGTCGVNPNNPCDGSNSTVDGKFATSYALLQPWLNPTSGGCTSSTTPIAAGQTVSGALSTTDCFGTYYSDRYHDKVTFSAAAGVSYTVTMTSSSFDTYLVVLGPSGALVAENDDDGTGTNSRAVFTAPSTGTYTVEATSYSPGATGSYAVSLSGGGGGGSAPAAPSGLTAGATSSSQIRLDWSDNSSDESDFRIERRDPSSGSFGQVATVGADTRTYSDSGLAPGATYTYRVRAGNSSGVSGYSNEASATTPAGGCTSSTTPIAAGQTVSGALSTTDCFGTYYSDRYHDKVTFSAAAGVSYTVTMTSSSFDTYLVVLGPSGALVAENDDDGTSTNSRAVFTAPSAGTYTVEATSYSPGATGSYAVSLAGSGGGSMPAAPADLRTTRIQKKKVTLAWSDRASNETYYDILAFSNNAWTSLGTLGPNASGVRIVRLQRRTTYRFGVRACNSEGCSPIVEINVSTR